MNNRLKLFSERLTAEIALSSSKSESNRALIINALTANATPIQNLSNARDTQTMLALLHSEKKILDVKDAGTTMRFLTAFLALNGADHTLTGTARMKQRPIGPLVETLRQLGAEIEYMEQEGYPPIKIRRISDQKSDHLEIPGNISSQYISALLMVAPLLPKGLKISLTTEVFSKPYIEMTLAIMSDYGAKFSWEQNDISVANQPYKATSFTVENDWSGASYWYSFVALAPPKTKIFLPHLKEKSNQGDSAISTIMQHLGVSSTFANGGVWIENTGQVEQQISLDFKSCPDLAQTIMVCAGVLGTSLQMTGLESLKIKETDRVAAMMAELEKLGVKLEENSNSWTLTPTSDLPSFIEVETYEDHRMAMAFAPLCNKMEVLIQEPEVVEKSYPLFWEEYKKLGVVIEKA